MHDVCELLCLLLTTKNYEAYYISYINTPIHRYIPNQVADINPSLSPGGRLKFNSITEE